jgi:putative restriction endonuclease
MSNPTEDLDVAIRAAAFAHVRRLNQVYGELSSAELKPGFEFRGERIPLANPQRGIFKPRQMRYLLSIRTVVPRPGGRLWYDDQTEAHRQIFEGEETIEYAFMGRNPDAADNRWLKEAMQNGIPVVYFLGVSPGRYQAILPAYIVGWDAEALKARLAFAESERAGYGFAEAGPDRRYALQIVKQRLHQASFRQAIISAYDGRCAISNLPEHRLVDAAHIVEDQHAELGQPVVPNGILLSKIHHAAFDAHLIGVDPDYRVHVSDRLLVQHDGPILEALKSIRGQLIRPPRRPQDKPDQDRLAIRFEQFKALR